MKTLLVVAARGGSKGVKNKNLLKISGKSLTYITLNKVSKYKNINKIVLTSDSTKILNQANRFKNIEKIKRPKELASDKANIFAVVRHALSILEKKNIWSPDIILLTTPTTPFKNFTHFQRCIKIMSTKKVGSAITIREPNYPTHWMLIKKKKFIKNIFHNGNRFKRRQDVPKTYQPAGTVYAFNKKTLYYLINKKKILPLKNTAGVIVKREESVNIDTLEDLKIAKFYSKKK